MSRRSRQRSLVVVVAMAALSLKVSVEELGVVKTMQFSAACRVEEACQAIRDKLPDHDPTSSDVAAKEYGLFLPVAGAAEDSPGALGAGSRGVWLENGRTLDYYMLRDGDTLIYGRKLRNLRVRMLDGTVKTMLVDDSQPVANLMVVICTKIGITNHDEYGLVREELKEEEEVRSGTLTLRRRHPEKERDAKMDQLRRKLRTDDEVCWVEGSMTLREQGVGSGETLLLRRRLFYSDRCVDARDPVQLNLLYVQARDNILDGTHPVPQRDAVEFAGIQCQVQFGDHHEDKHTPGLLDLKEFLPASYVKVKGIEKKVLKQHATHSGLSELDAKLLYTQRARALPTYGVAFFLVKEKMKGKNKLVPRLLGVTAESVLRLDERTKEVIQSWPLTTVRRWCASPNTFTLDFGDYSDQYYSVQTTEAEQILQVIAGYIDLIVRRRQRAEHVGLDGDEGSAMVEESVRPGRANIIRHETGGQAGRAAEQSLAKPAVIRPGADGAKPFAVVHSSSVQQTTVQGQILTGHQPPNASSAQEARIAEVRAEPKRALLEAIRGGRELLQRTEESLTTLEISESDRAAAQGQSVEWVSSRVSGSARGVTARLAAMSAAAASMVSLSAAPPEEMDHTAIGAAVTTITASLPEVTTGVQRIASLMEPAGGERLLDATRALCRAFSDLLTAAEPDTPQPRQSILTAASRVGEASTGVMTSLGVDGLRERETQETVLSLAKGAANAAAALVLGAKQLASRAPPAQQTRVVAAATHAAFSTSQLVATAKVVAPSLSSEACRAQLAAAARAVARAVQQVLDACEPTPPDAAGAKDQLTAAATDLTRELDRLLAYCQHEEESGGAAAARVVAAGERVLSASPTDIVHTARTLGHETAQLISMIKAEAEAAESSGGGAMAARRLLAAAKLLADATARLVEAARQCAHHPQDSTRVEAVRAAAEEVREVALEYGRARAGSGARLAHAALRVVDAARQLIDVASQQESLQSECATLSSTLHHVEEAARAPDDTDTTDLIAASETMLQACGSAVSAARGVAPSLPPPQARPLADCSQALTSACVALRAAVGDARDCGRGTELQGAANTIRGLQETLLSTETVEYSEDKPVTWWIARVSVSGRSVSSSAAALASAARRQDAPAAARAAPALAAALHSFTSAAARSAPHSHEPNRVLECGSQVLEYSETLVETVQRHLTHGDTTDSADVSDIAHNISEAVSRTVSSLGSHSALDSAITRIQRAMDSRTSHSTTTTTDIRDLQQSLQQSAAAVSEAAAEVTEQSPQAADHLANTTETLIEVVSTIQTSIQDTETVSLVERRLTDVVQSSRLLLGVAKRVSMESDRPRGGQELAQAARAVTDAINRLVSTCSEAAVQSAAAAMQAACLAAARSVRAAGAGLTPDCCLQADHALQHHDLLPSLLRHSKALSEGMAGLAGAARRSEQEPFIRAVGTVAAAAIGLVDAAQHAAYLTGISSAGSQAGRLGLVDGAAVSRAQQHINAACDMLQDLSATQPQVLSAATEIAKHTSGLCALCRAASARSPEPLAKRLFVHAAKDVANATAHLVTIIKALDADYSEENRAKCAQATEGLRSAVRGLRAFADSPEFAPVPPRVSPQGLHDMEPILQCGRAVVSGTASLLEAGSSLAANAEDGAAWRALAAHGQTLSDAVKTLVTYTRDNAPGQRSCSEALETLERLQQSLARAAGQAANGDLPRYKDSQLQGYLEQLESSGAELTDQLGALADASRDHPENLPHVLQHVVRMAEALEAGAVGAACALDSSSAQSQLLQHAQTVLEALAMLVRAAKAAGGNPRAEAAHTEVTSCVSQCSEALRELAEVTRGEAARRGALKPLLDSLSRSIARLADNRMSLAGFDESASFGDYQSRVTASVREVSRLASETAAAGQSERGERGRPLVAQFEELAREVVCACAAAPQPDAADSVRAAALQLGETIADLLQADTADTTAALTRVTQKTALLLSALQAGARGSQACAEAAQHISHLVQDLDTTILFASAGTLQSQVEGDSFAEHREGILRSAKALVEDTKALVGGAGGAGDQEALAQAAMAARGTLAELCQVAKAGAAALCHGGAESGEGQVLVLAAARDAAHALRDLCAATAAAAGRPHHSPHMQRLKHAAKSRRRWSAPAPAPAPGPALAPRPSDSDTDALHSDIEDELVRLFDYSSQDDDISPSVFHDHCEEAISYIDSLMIDPPKRTVREDVNDRYNMTARNSLVDMNFRVVKYGETIFLGEIKKFVDVVADLFERAEQKRVKQVLKRLKASNELDQEMKRISQVIEDMDSEIENEGLKDNVEEIKEKPANTVAIKESVISPKSAKLGPAKLRKPVLKVKKLRPVNLVLKFDTKILCSDIKAKPTSNGVLSPEQNDKESTEIEIDPKVVVKDKKTVFWKMFKHDSVRWKDLAKKNLEKIEETRKDLERFAGKELVLKDLEDFEKEKDTLQSFIDNVDESRSVNKDLEYDKKYEDMVLKLIEFAKKDFMFKGFDPLIEKLRVIANTPFEWKTNKTTVQELINIYTQIDISKYTYEELCVLEKYYEEIMRKYKIDANQNIQQIKIRAPSLERDRSPSLVREETKSAPPSYHRNVILNLHSSQNLTKRIHRHSTAITDVGSTRTKSTDRNSQTEIFDLTRTYPLEYYANNWWSIYEDILQRRERQYGSMDNWWRFYERILSQEPTDEGQRRLQRVVRQRVRPSHRAETQLRELDGVKHTLRETEAVETRARETQAVDTTAVETRASGTQAEKTCKQESSEQAVETHTVHTRASETKAVVKQGEVEPQKVETRAVDSGPSEPVMVTNVTSLLKTVKAVEDEHSRGARALEAAIDSIEQEIEELVSGRGARATATADDLTVVARLVPGAAARAVAASGQQAALTAAANGARRDMAQLLQACKGAASTAESSDLSARCIEAGRACAAAFVALLRALLAGQDASTPARAVAAAVAELLATADMLRGAEWAEAEAVVAENELLGAAAAVDQAADELAQLTPQLPQEGSYSDTEGWEGCEGALFASRDIVAATAELVRAAAQAQRDLVEQGVVPWRPAASSADGQWALGLVSAARLVVAAAQAVAQAAQQLAQGSGTEERLVSSARQLASSTAQLLVACKVKAEPGWASTRRLVAAGGRVLRAADALVAAARACSQRRDQRSLVLDRRVVGGIAQEIDARSEVLRIEKELEEARGRLTAIRQAKYRLRGSPDDTDHEREGSLTRDNTLNSTTYSHTQLNNSYDLNNSYNAPKSHNLSHNLSSFGQDTSYGQNTSSFTHEKYGSAQDKPSYGQNTSSFGQERSNVGQNTSTSSFTQERSTFGQNMSNVGQNTSSFGQNTSSFVQSPVSPLPESHTLRSSEEITSRSQLGSFKPQEPPRTYEGFTTRYETKLYDTPRPLPTEYRTVDEQRVYQSRQSQHSMDSRTHNVTMPLSPKFNARELKFDDRDIRSYNESKSPLDGVGQTFSEHQKSTEKIPGGIKESEYSVKSETYSSFPKTEYSKTVTREDVRSPFATSTPSKAFQYEQMDAVKASTVPPERVSSPYNRSGANFTEESTTEVKDIPNGTQKITTTKIYSSSPVNITSTNTKYEPIKVEATDEVAKYESDSRYSTLDSKASDTSRSFMRPSEFHSQRNTDMLKELDGMDRKFSKQTITSETIERKSVMTSSHKSETSSTTTKKFGNF